MALVLAEQISFGLFLRVWMVVEAGGQYLGRPLAGLAFLPSDVEDL